MNRIFFTITGTKYCFGTDFLKPDMKVKLVKEPDNKFDKEAIRVEMEGLGKVGYVANSPISVLGESMSAGRIYDKISVTAEGTILYVLPNGVLGYINSESLPGRGEQDDGQNENVQKEIVDQVSALLRRYVDQYTG